MKKLLWWNIDKIYSRRRIRIPKIIFNNKKINHKNINKFSKLIVILLNAFGTMKLILDSVIPIFDTLAENKAASIATMISNDQATAVMREHTYDELFTIEKDSEGNIRMIEANILVINEITSSVANKIQTELDNTERENIEIAIRKFYWV